MGTWSSHRTTCRHRTGGGPIILAALAVALLLPPAGVAYASVEDDTDAAPAATLGAGATDDSSGNDHSDSASVAHVVPQVSTVIENGPLTGYEFSLVLKDANNQELDEVTNDSDGNVSFSQLDFTAHDLDVDAETGKPVATTFTYYVSELPDDERLYVYDKGIIKVSVTVAPVDDGTLQADVAYARLDDDGNQEPIDEPTFTNRFVTVLFHHIVRDRMEPYDPLPSVHYGLWMVNPNGEDWYMGLGRNQQQTEGSRLESDDNGNLWWDMPVLSYACYYFMEEWPPPAGRLVDPYPTDYFQLVFDEDNGYRVVYETDPEFLPPYGGMMRRNRTGEDTGSGGEGSAGDKPTSDSPTSENPTGDSPTSAGSTSGNPASGSTTSVSPTSGSPMSATTKAQQPTVAATSRTSTQKLPATSDTTGGNPTLAFAGALVLLVGSMRKRRA